MMLDAMKEVLTPILLTSAIGLGGWISADLVDLRMEITTIQTEQIIDKQVNREVREMSVLMARMDANIKHIKENQSKSYEILNKVLK
jgi:hypothetical protein